MAGLDELRTSASAFLASRPAPAAHDALVAPPRFSAFIPADVAEASALADRLADAARAAGGGDAGIAAAIALASQEATQASPAVAKYALLIFLTHDADGARLGVPPLEERHPEAVRSMVAAAAAAPGTLAFFREDVMANEHHEHWHVVYRTNSPAELDRQGELFVYMHQQMLARYDTERLALGQAPVEPLDVTQPITEGYDPYAGEAYGPRAPGRQLPTAIGGKFARAGQAYSAAIAGDRFEHALSGAHPPPVAAGGTNAPLDLLGATIEQHADALAGLDATDYGLHNTGHVEIANLSTGTVGVMYTPTTAIRDPVFWQWHRHIDDYGYAWQERRGPRDYAGDPDQAPPGVRLRKALAGRAGESPDIIVCTRQAMALADFTDVAAGQAWAQTAFGGPHWDADPSTIPAATSELLTTMTDRLVRFADGTTVNVQHLDQADEFAWLLRLENPTAGPVETTVRIFLAAEQLADNRRMWIEMDKFVTTVAGGARTVVYRPSSLSSVIRKPAGKPTAPPAQADHVDSADYCQCGWPYNLLLPRGTHAGMPCRVLVMLTDAAYDRVEAEHPCGSMSFCGARDRYPDRREMGYPFDRPLNPSVTAALDALPQTARRSLTIRWV